MIKININNKFINHFISLNICDQIIHLINIYKANNIFIHQFGINIIQSIKEA